MAAGNYSVYYATNVDSFKFGQTAWTEAQMAHTTVAMDTSFASNNATALLNIAASAVDSNSPVKAAAFAKDFSITGNEMGTSEEPLLGHDSVGAQNQEISITPNSLYTCECTLVYRNNVPLSIFNSSTRCALIEMNNNESATTGAENIAMNNIKVNSVGGLQRNSDGLMEQKLKFSFRGGTAGSVTTVTQSAPAETWSKVRAGLDYAEEFRTA